MARSENLSGSRLPRSGIFPAVKAGQYGNIRVGYGIDQTVWKSRDSRPAKLSPHDLVLKRILLDRGNGKVHGANEFNAKSRAALIVPVAGLDDLGFGFGLESQLAAHL
jgi:hypothetical protein